MEWRELAKNFLSKTTPYLLFKQKSAARARVPNVVQLAKYFECLSKTREEFNFEVSHIFNVHRVFNI